MNGSFQTDLMVNDVTYSDFLVTKIGEDLYRLEEHPIMSEELNYKDVIEAKFENEKLIFQKLYQKSDLKHFNYLFSKENYNSKKFENLLKQIDESDGYWTQAFGGCLFVSLPKDSKFNLYEKVQELFKK
jgi:hypothetical protein